MILSPSEYRRCPSGCGAPVVLAQVSGGRDDTVWLDARSSASGVYTLARVGELYRAVRLTRAAQITGARASGVGLHADHTKTCPNRTTVPNRSGRR